MKIVRVLNTNTVLTTDEDGDELVVLGSGIGFKSKAGDEIPTDKIEKKFILKEKAHQSSFAQLINTIPEEYIYLAERIISLGKALHDMTLNESIHISLADHIHSAVENFEVGIVVPNALLLDIRQFYPNEYDVAIRALEMIKDQFGYQLPADEAGFIAMHFVNAEYGDSNTNANRIIQMVSEINQLILRELQIDPDKNSLNYYRYMTHLKSFSQRILQNYHFKDDDMGILNEITFRYRREYNCSRKVGKYVKERYGYQVGHDEILYLTVHLAHITQN